MGAIKGQLSVEDHTGRTFMVAVGYELKHTYPSVVLPDGFVVTPQTLTHAIAEKMKDTMPMLFRKVMMRGYYELNAPYWGDRSSL